LQNFAANSAHFVKGFPKSKTSFRLRNFARMYLCKNYTSVMKTTHISEVRLTCIILSIGCSEVWEQNSVP